MITILSYIVLENFAQDWSGWLLVLPVLLDLGIINKIETRCDKG